MTDKELRGLLREAFSQNEGWTKRQLAERLSGSNDPREPAFADALAFLDVELDHYYIGKAADHGGAPADLWYSRRATEKRRRAL